MATRSDNKEKLEMRTTLGEVLQKKGMTKYHFAVKELKQKPNTLTPWDKPKFDPKLSSVIKMAKKLGCDVNDLFQAEGYSSTTRTTTTKTPAKPAAKSKVKTKTKKAEVRRSGSKKKANTKKH
jgi:DNA-binding XRE family transcriptional regulator